MVIIYPTNFTDSLSTHINSLYETPVAIHTRTNDSTNEKGYSRGVCISLLGPLDLVLFSFRSNKIVAAPLNNTPHHLHQHIPSTSSLPNTHHSGSQAASSPSHCLPLPSLPPSNSASQCDSTTSPHSAPYHPPPS
jgi:hypothetical protein